ncbi:MAG: hypothetical protein DHS20C11_07490 [Lysobacteraceae bacterium]|nr:MAG: hypothetical protein DHS20C11_07490 [Xanthomonadaceae bacterium]
MNMPQVIRGSQQSEYYFDERCYITEWLNVESSAQLSIARARVEPGVTTAWHQLTGITERYVVLSGQGLVAVGDLETTVSAGDVVIIPPDTRQRISNTCQQQDLIFLAICSPRFRVSAYVDLECMN